jgi:hypothetical protein
LRNRLLRGRHEQRAVAAVEHVQVAALRRRDHRRHLAAPRVEVDERRLAADVHVPQVVVDRLVDPAHLAGREVERDDGAVEALAVRDAVAAPDVGRLVAHRQVDEPEALVGAGDAPHVGRVAHVGAARRQRRRLVGIARVPVPHELPGVDVEAADDARRLVGRVVVGHARGGDEDCARSRAAVTSG